MKRCLVLVIVIMGGIELGGNAYAGVNFGQWTYGIDSQNDGSGGAIYEDRGLAYSQQGSNLLIAISSGMKLGGNIEAGSLNGTVAHGDMFLNFSGHNLDAASKFNDPKVFGIRYDAANDSLGNTAARPNTTLGVYGGLSVTSMARQNLGYSSLQQYIDHGFGRTAAAMGDLQSSNVDVKGYLGSGLMMTSITSGNRLGDITLLDSASLAGRGLNFAHFGADPAGNYIYGFSFNTSLLRSTTGGFTLHEFEECTNDGVALNGSISGLIISQAVPAPEPSTLASAGLAVLVGIGAWIREKGRNDRQSVRLVGL